METSPQSPAFATFWSGFGAGWAPEPELTVSEWADEHRMLSSKASAAPGPWRTGRTPYLEEPMDALSARSTSRDHCFMKGAQVGGTEAGNNWVAYVIHHVPAPMLMVLPTLDVARKVSKQRLAPMIEATPALRERIGSARSRDSGNATFQKDFPGGQLLLAGANSAASLRSMPIRFLFCDEVDAYPGDVDGEGDPIGLAMKRLGTFGARAKSLLVSTPTVKGQSRIESAYLASDQRRYVLTCPHCGHQDYLTWDGKDWLGENTGNHFRIAWDEGKPESAHMVCPSCLERIGEHYKNTLLERGRWVAQAVGNGTIGWHLSALYSPLGWFKWSQAVSEFLEAKDDPTKVKVWVNTVLGETYEDQVDKVEHDVVLARRETYEAEVPHGVGVLVASVDVQDNRLECKVKGYGAGEESWLIAYTQFHGDPGQPAVWLELDDFLQSSFRHASGRAVRIKTVAIDSGGHHTEAVYRFCKVRMKRRVWAVRGGNQVRREVVGRPTDKNRYRVKLFTLCTDTAKDIIFSRLAIQRPKPGTPAPGYMHFPDHGEIVDEAYARGLTAEVPVKKYKGGQTVRVWEKIRERNEPLDLEVYALAALYILGPTYRAKLRRAAAIMSRPLEGKVAPAPLEPGVTRMPELPPAPAPPVEPPVPARTANAAKRALRRRRSNWATGWDR